MRLRHWLLNFFTALSLLLCVAASVLWIRSLVRHDVVRYGTAGGDRYGLIADRGTLLFEHQSNLIYHGGRLPSGWELTSRLSGGPPPRTMAWQNPATERRLFGYGVVINRGVATQGQVSARPGAWRNLVLLLPCWLFLVIFGVLPALFVFRSVLAIRRRNKDQCPSCGYDLRATPDRCPECGAVPAQRRATTTVATSGTQPSSGGMA